MSDRMWSAVSAIVTMAIVVGVIAVISVRRGNKMAAAGPDAWQVLRRTVKVSTVMGCVLVPILVVLGVTELVADKPGPAALSFLLAVVFGALVVYQVRTLLPKLKPGWKPQPSQYRKGPTANARMWIVFAVLLPIYALVQVLVAVNDWWTWIPYVVIVAVCAPAIAWSRYGLIKPDDPDYVEPESAPPAPG